MANSASAADSPTPLAVSCVKAFMPGDSIEGKYRLEGVLGEGAMGRVWLARNVTLDLPLAIKIVQPELHGHEAMARLLTEARALAQLRHPNIVRVFDYQSDGQAAYAVMELLEGCTLGDLMDQGPLPAPLAVRLMLPILSGLAAAHRAGIVHRDVKPQNVFIARTGDRICPKLLDFGIARLDARLTVSAVSAVSGVSAPRPRSNKRLIIGSPGYMSPEQAWGEADVDERTDMWSVAVVLYEAISGKSAFATESYRGFLRALADTELKPLRGPGCVRLWAILSRALCKARDQRIASASEFAAELGAWLSEWSVDEDLSGDTLSTRWVPPEGLVARAMARTAEATLVSLPSGLPRSILEPLCDAMNGIDRGQAKEPATVADRSGVRTIASRRTRAHERALTFVTLAASALLGAAVAMARTEASERVTLQSQPSEQRQPHTASAQLRAATHKAKKRASATALEAAAPAAADQPVSRATVSVGMPVVVTAPREVRVPNSALAVRRRAAVPQASAEADPRQQLRREAAALGLKSPW